MFIGYRNGIIIVFYLWENDSDNKEENIKEVIKNDNEINNIFFETKFFRVLFIGANKGFNLKQIKGKKIFEDNSTACLSFCFDNNKNYLFAGFADGIIRVYLILDEEEIKSTAAKGNNNEKDEEEEDDDDGSEKFL